MYRMAINPPTPNKMQSQLMTVMEVGRLFIMSLLGKWRARVLAGRSCGETFPRGRRGAA
jgi:hypothetical protein